MDGRPGEKEYFYVGEKLGGGYQTQIRNNYLNK